MQYSEIQQHFVLFVFVFKLNKLNWGKIIQFLLRYIYIYRHFKKEEDIFDRWSTVLLQCFTTASQSIQSQ